jgi:L-asparaginase/Glu-tRNA(Gln) amidotransferase subunit D
MPKLLRNLAAAVLASGFACNFSWWAQQAINNELPMVWVLSTGGTIAGTGASPTNVAEYKGSTVLGEDLVMAVPHGTNTLEETAYFLNLTISTTVP